MMWAKGKKLSKTKNIGCKQNKALARAVALVPESDRSRAIIPDQDIILTQVHALAVSADGSDKVLLGQHGSLLNSSNNGLLVIQVSVIARRI